MTSTETEEARPPAGGTEIETATHPEPSTTSRPGSTGKWVLIKAGTFFMGTPPAEVDRNADEPYHSVTLTHSFWMHRTEVTQEEWSDVMGYNPSLFAKCGSSCPVDSVSWNEALAFCNTISAREGLPECYRCTGTAPEVECSLILRSPYTCAGYRLPTEAEWEYAARAGTKTATYVGPLPQNSMQCDEPASNLLEFEWFCGDSTHPVAQKRPNPWGLFDMLGNLSEWCYDWRNFDIRRRPAMPVTDPVGLPIQPPPSLSGRVYRGGAWNNYASLLRAAHSGWADPAERSEYVGFRPVRTDLPTPTSGDETL